MANTVSILSYANTFGDWVVTTNALVAENNDIAANNYVKPTGTLYLNSPTLGLQVGNNAIIAGQLQVQGVGSSAYIQNNLRVDNQLYLQNTTLSLVASGQANVSGPILAMGSGTGLAVSNNTTIGGTLNVSRTSTLANTNVNGIITVSGTSTLTGNVSTGNALTVAGDLVANKITSNTTLIVPTANISADATIYGSAVVYGQLNVGGDFVVDGSTIYNSNNFTLSADTLTAVNSTFTVNRGTTGANAAIRWNESQKYFDIKNVDSELYSKILTSDLLSSNPNLSSSSNVATSSAVNSVFNSLATANNFLQANDATTLALAKTYTDTANTYLKSYTDTQLTINNSVNTTQNTFAQAAFNKANTGSGTFNGTTGQAIAVNGVFSFASNNGTITSATANTLYINTAQDIRTTASPTFNGLTLTNALPINQGGTGQTSSGAALTALLPTGTISGYVLTTGGPGSFYWTAGGGGGGATPGTTINSTRLTYTGNGSTTAYTAPTYIPGASQLRVYIDGVRQFPSDYTETNGTTVTFVTAPPSTSIVLLEVDGYIVNPYYANNIAYTVNSTISNSANTIQLAIDGLTSLVALKSGTTFTGLAAAPTAATSTSNTQIATTAYVNNVANSGFTFAHNISGTAATATLATLATTATTANTSNALNTGSNYQVNSFGVGTPAPGTTGEIRATNNITAYFSSDKKFKENIENIPNALDAVDVIGGKLFDWTDAYLEAHGGIDDYFNQKSDFGVIAQDVQSVFPRAVRTRPDGSLAVDYEKLVALSFAAIKELKAEIDILKGSK
jgi:hypothetical protein